jgi:hypothetical protein
MPMILGRLQKNRAVGTASFEVLVSPPLPDSAGWAIGRCILCSKTPSDTGAHVEAFVDSSSTTALLARGTCCRSRISKCFSSFCAWSRWATNCGSLQLHSPLTCLMINWESPFTSSYRSPRDSMVLGSNMRASYSAMLLVALKSRCTLYLNYSPSGVKSRTPALAPCLHEELSKKSVQ